MNSDQLGLETNSVESEQQVSVSLNVRFVPFGTLQVQQSLHVSTDEHEEDPPQHLYKYSFPSGSALQ